MPIFMKEPTIIDWFANVHLIGFYTKCNQIVLRTNWYITFKWLLILIFYPKTPYFGLFTRTSTLNIYPITGSTIGQQVSIEIKGARWWHPITVEDMNCFVNAWVTLHISMRVCVSCLCDCCSCLNVWVIERSYPILHTQYPKRAAVNTLRNTREVSGAIYENFSGVLSNV